MVLKIFWIDVLDVKMTGFMLCWVLDFFIFQECAVKDGEQGQQKLNTDNEWRKDGWMQNRKEQNQLTIFKCIDFPFKLMWKNKVKYFETVKNV